MSSERISKFQTLVGEYQNYLKENAFPSLSNLHPPVGGTAGTTVSPELSAAQAAVDQDPQVLAAREKAANQLNGGQNPTQISQAGTPVPGATSNPTVQDPNLQQSIENHPEVIAAKKKVADAIALQQKKPANTITNP